MMNTSPQFAPIRNESPCYAIILITAATDECSRYYTDSSQDLHGHPLSLLPQTKRRVIYGRDQGV